MATVFERHTRVHRLLKQRYTRFIPQVATKQKGGIRAGSHQRRRQDGRGIVVTHNLICRRLQMHLERGGGGFQHHIVVLQRQLFVAGNVDAQRAPAPAAEHLIIQRVIAIERGHVGKAQIALAYRRQRTDRNDGAFKIVRSLQTLIPGGTQFVFKSPQRTSAQRLWCAVEFDIELR